MMWSNWGNGPGFFGMGWGMLLFWGLVLAGVLMLLRTLGRDRPDAPASADGALKIVAQRYARGEIDRAEFEQKRRDLGAL